MELPDDDSIPACPCRNTGRYHTCSEFCKEYMGCNEECKKKKHPQKLQKATVCQSLATSLPGPIQTTPRAELYAIWLAIAYGPSPQLIITDHNNHVIGLEDMVNGVYKVLHPLTPNVDIWRKIKESIQRRGGLQKTGPNRLWAE